MDEVGYEVVLGDVLEAEATDICRKEVKLHGQRIRRAAAKAVVPDEVLPAAPEECPDCIAWHRAWDEREAMWGDRKKMWEDDREIAQRQLQAKDREIAHLTDRASHYEAEMRDLEAMIKSRCSSKEVPTEAEAPAAPMDLNEYGDVGLR